MESYILALDEGTTSARSILFDRTGHIVSMAQNEFPQYYPEPGWVEQDPLELYAAQYASLTACVAQSGIRADQIAAVGITNQRETVIVWEKATGRPIYNAIVWQCRRTAEMCRELERQGLSDRIRDKTGLRLDPYFSATKLAWILDRVEGAREAAGRGELLFGTVDTWLLWKLTGGAVHKTDRTNASRTMLYNIVTGDWDEELLALFDIPRCMLPEVCDSSEVYGTLELMGARLPIAGIAGDQQAALFGQTGFEPGDVKTTYGTGCFLLANTGNQRVQSRHGLLTTVAAGEKGSPTQYVLEGSVFIGGSVVKWLREEMHLIDDAADSEYFAGKVADTGGVYIVPAFTGLGAPHWDAHARGMITGLTRGTGREHLIRAALESIAYQTDDVFRAMQSELGRPLRGVRVDGGASANNFLMQFQADLSDLPVTRPLCRETTALGAAFLAGLAVGFYRDREELRELTETDRTFLPDMAAGRRQQLREGWQKAVAACMSL